MSFCEGGIIKIKRLMISGWLINKGFAFILPVVLAIGAAYGNVEFSDDYRRLVELIQLDDLQQPLYVFNDFEEEFDKASYRATRRYFNEHPGLIRRIKHHLGDGKLRWKLRKLKHRLLFVPENRTEYATLYKNYCLDVIRAILDKTGLQNPYESIQIPQQGKPAYHKGNNGITAYIVHNLAREYNGTYIFFNQKDKKVKIKLEGKIYTGEVGAYTSNLTITDDGAVEFLKDKYTVWQNSADNPYTALMVPAEETLHILLREHTEKAIKNTIEHGQIRNLKAVKRIVEDWMAVEEAIVGGIIRLLLPQILEEHMDDHLPVSWIENDMEVKSRFKKYRHLRKGILMVEDMGHKKAIKLYAENPILFRELLI